MTTTCKKAAAPRFPTTKPTWKMSAVELARVWADHFGVHTHATSGGWLYTKSERPYVQGWDNLASRLQANGIIVLGKGINWSKGVMVG